MLFWLSIIKLNNIVRIVSESMTKESSHWIFSTLLPFVFRIGERTKSRWILEGKPGNNDPFCSPSKYVCNCIWAGAGKRQRWRQQQPNGKEIDSPKKIDAVCKRGPYCEHPYQISTNRNFSPRVLFPLYSSSFGSMKCWRAAKNSVRSCHKEQTAEIVPSCQKKKKKYETFNGKSQG